MKSIIRAFVLILFTAETMAFAPLNSFAGDPPVSRTVTFETSDGVTIHGDLFTLNESTSNPVILLFHQGGGDARGEYGPIIGPLLDHGYNVLAVDLRVGGERFGGINRTIADLDGREYSYCEALPDLKASLDWIESEGFDGPKAIWGSSYSAALVLRLAATHGPELSAALAFSPSSGGPLADCRGEDVAADITIPVLIMRPASEMERESARGQMLIFENHGFESYVAENGVHGSSMLVASRAEGSVEQTWNAVFSFLERSLKNP